MALDSRHPKYDEYNEDWITMRDLYKGERAVKKKTTDYLPPTKGMNLDGMKKGEPGRDAYDAYLLRAVFHDYVKEAVEAYIGMMHRKPPTIKLPSVMEPLREFATAHGESLELVLRKINEEQLVTGRVGLLLDLPESPSQENPLPYIAIYIAESITNWDDGESEEGEGRLNLVVLDESGFTRTSGFEWITQTKYRVLQLGELNDNEYEGQVPYVQGVFSDNSSRSISYDPTQMKIPLLRGKKLEKIPFVFANTKDVVANPDEPPLLGLGRLSLAVYRGEADYRQNLFMQGQDTLVTIGAIRKEDLSESEEAPLRTGAGARLEIEMGGDAKYIGVSSQGLPEQRTALQNDQNRAHMRSGQLATGGGQKESGEALKTRINAQTATLNQIAFAGASALEHILKICAEWMGANPDQVEVIPNTEFADYNFSGQDLVQLMSARTMGAPLSKESIHNLLVERGLTKLDFKSEIDLIEEENAEVAGTTAGGNVFPDNEEDEEGAEE